MLNSVVILLTMGPLFYRSMVTFWIHEAQGLLRVEWAVVMMEMWSTATS